MDECAMCGGGSDIPIVDHGNCQTSQLCADCQSSAVRFNTRQAFIYAVCRSTLEDAEVSKDNNGQLIIYTGFWAWSDGSVRNYEEGGDKQ